MAFDVGPGFLLWEYLLGFSVREKEFNCPLFSANRRGVFPANRALPSEFHCLFSRGTTSISQYYFLK